MRQFDCPPIKRAASAQRGPGSIEEVFYTGHVWRGLFLAGDVQHVNNPGYNRARGPFTVPGVRLHLEF